MSRALALIRRNSVYWAVLGAYLVGFFWSRIDGIRFDASTRGFYWQFLASDHMLGDTPAALWYMHIQPAGFNLALAVTDFFYPSVQARIFEATYFVFGAALALMVSWLVTYWSGFRWVGLFAGLLIVALPSTYIYGAWLHYTYVIAFLVVLSVFLFCAASAWHKPLLAPLALLPLLGLFLVRSSFAWFFVLLFGLAVVWWSRKLGASKRAVIALAVLVTLVVGVFTLRSLAMFGQMTQSSWGGNILAAQIWVELSPDQKVQIATKHPEFKELLERRTPFSELSADDIANAKAELPPDAPLAYTEPFKPNERINWNFAGYLPLSKQWQAFALTAIQEYPDEYVEAVITSTGNYFSNQTCYNWVDENASQVVAWRSVTSGLLLLGGAGEDCESSPNGNFVFLPWLMVAASLIAVPFAWRRSEQIRVTYLFAVSVMVIALVTTVLVAYVEQQRMRMEIDFLLIATGIAGLAMIIEAIATWRTRQIPTLHE